MKQFSLFALLFVFATQAFGQNQLFYYTVQKEGAPNSYILGTLHLMPAENVVLNDAFNIEGGLQSCEELILEADVFNVTPQEVMKFGMLPNGGHLDTALTADDYELLDAALISSAGVGLDAFKNFKPFMIDATLMASAVPEGSTSYEGALVASEYIAHDAKPISYLETVEEQLSFFDEIPVRTQLAQTVDYLKEPGGMEAEYQKLLEIYLAGDLPNLYAYTVESIEDPNFLYLMLEKRNRAWLPTLVAKMHEKSIFLAVGAAHLGGETGIIALLEKEGFTVTQFVLE